MGWCSRRRKGLVDKCKCGSSFPDGSGVCQRCGTARTEVNTDVVTPFHVDTETELDKLLVKADTALSVLSSPFGPCCCPFRWRKAQNELHQVVETIRLTPKRNLIRRKGSADLESNLDDSGLDHKTSSYIKSILGKNISKESVHPEGMVDRAMSLKSSISESILLSPRTYQARSVPVPVFGAAETPAGSVTLVDVCDESTFDIFEVAHASQPGALFFLLFRNVVDIGLNVLRPMNLSFDSFGPLLHEAQAMYEDPYSGLGPNTYHSALHGADVLCSSVAMLMKLPRSCLGSGLTPVAKFATVVAALLHDIGHPGVQARFLHAVRHSITFSYFDESPLERMHVSHIFRLLSKHGGLDTLDEAEYRKFRFLLCRMVLATDLAKGYSSIMAVKSQYPSLFYSGGDFKAKRVSRRSLTESELNGPSKRQDVNPSFNMVSELLNIVIECADVAHPTKPLVLHQRWSALLMQEFLRQGDLEERLGYPVSPLCDRTSLDAVSFARGQRGFSDFVVLPKFDVLSRLCAKSTVWIGHMRKNREYWSSAEVPELSELVSQLQRNPAFEGALKKVHTSVSLSCSCGNPYIDDAVFCRKCGSKRESSKRSPSPDICAPRPEPA